MLSFAGAASSFADDIAFHHQHIQHAQSELKAGQWLRALHRFRWLLFEGAPDEQFEVAYQNTIQSITAKHPLSFSLNAALLPSNNVSNGSSESYFVTDFGVFEVDSAKDRKSGVGLQLSAGAAYKIPYAQGKTWTITLSFGGNFYGEKELQLRQSRFSASHEWLSSGRQTNVSLALSDTSYRSIADRHSPDHQSVTLQLSHSRHLSRAAQAAFYTSVQDVKYPSRSYNDGQHISLTLVPSIKISKQDKVSLKIGQQRSNLASAHLSNKAGSVGLFWDRTERNGLTWGIGAETTWRDFDARFPGVQFNRRDHVRDIVLSATHARIQFKGMNPKLRCTLRDHYSNVALYDYNTIDCVVSLNYHF